MSLMSAPREMSISITGRCNLKCSYCFYADEMVALSDLSTESWLTFFQELGRIKVFSVSLTGGEAFAHPDLFELIDGVIANHMRYGILSNGTLIDEDTIRAFEVGKRRLRLDSIQISIDGSCAEVHNKSRPHSFERALRGLRLLKDAGLPVMVRTTINRHNVHDLESIARLLLEDVGLPSFSTNEAVPMGSGCQNAGEISLTALERVEAMATLVQLQERYPGRLKAQAGPQALHTMYGEMELARRTGVEATRWKMGYLSGCGCTFNKLDVLHDGSIVPCTMLHRLVLGNITRDSIQEIWHTHPVLQAMRERQFVPMAVVPGCSNCEWAPYCNGGCPALSYEMTGDLNRANPQDCYRQFLRATEGDYVREF